MIRLSKLIPLATIGGLGYAQRDNVVELAEKPLDIVRLWAHECHRVWRDRLVLDEDREAYLALVKAAIKEQFEFKEEDVLEEPIHYTSYVAKHEGHDLSYLPIKSMEHLKGVLESKLEEYNE